MAFPSTSSPLWKKLAARQQQDHPTPPFGWTVHHTEPEPLPSPPAPDKRELCEEQKEEEQVLVRLLVFYLMVIGPIRFRAQDIIRAIAVKHGMTLDDVLAHNRKKPFVLVRHEAVYELARLTGLSLPQMGKALGGFDHTTMISSIRAHAQRNGLPLLRGIKPKVRKP